MVYKIKKYYFTSLSFALLFFSANTNAQNTAVTFDGTNDYITIPDANNLDLTSGYTLEAWIYVSSASSGAGIVSKYHAIGSVGYNLTLTTTSTYTGIKFDGQETADAVIATGKWHHIAAVNTAGTRTLYINGSAVALTGSANTVTANTDVLTVGVDYLTTAASYLNGKIDEVRIWNIARSATDIQNNMYKELVGSETGLVSYYKLNDNTGTAATNSVSGGTSGTLTNSPTWATTYAPISSLQSGYTTSQKAIWASSGTTASTTSNGLWFTSSSTLTEANIMVYGNNNSSSESSSDLTGTSCAFRTGRIWYLDATGTVSVAATIDLGDAIGTSNTAVTASKYKLLYRAGTTGNFTVVAQGSSIANTDQITFASYTFTDGYYAVGLLMPTVTTLAGSTTQVSGSSNGTGTAAKFNGPSGVVVDASGNIYVADHYNHIIRKITSEGVVTTLAGGTSGFLNATGTSAQFYYPTTLALDGSGNLFVSDKDNYRIRKIVISSGDVTTLAGSGSSGSADGTGISASFSQPFGIATNSDGTIMYVADKNNHRIRKIIISTGVVTTFAGSSAGSTDGTGTSASFNTPFCVTVDASGNVYVSDYGNHKIRKITSAGVVTTLAGSGVAGSIDATGTSATFYNPIGIAVDGNGNVYVGDYYNNKIRKITSGGVVTTLAGGGTYGYGDGAGTSALFRNPQGIAIHPSNNDLLYVADHMNNIIRQIGGDGTLNNILAPTISSFTPTTHGPGGTVTITGTNLLGATAVSFGGTAATSFTIVSSTSITAVVANGTTGVVSVTTPGGTITSSGFTYDPALPVELKSFTANVINGIVNLNWVTATESANFGFDIERKTGNTNPATAGMWIKIGFVKGSGTSTSEKSYSYQDASVKKGKHSYRLKQIDRDGKFEYHKEAIVNIGIEPNKIVLDGNYPNPFNPNTIISYQIPVKGNVTLKIFDILGKEVATIVNEIKEEGFHQVNFNASNLMSGVYYCKLQSNGQSEIKKMVLMK